MESLQGSNGAATDHIHGGVAAAVEVPSASSRIWSLGSAWAPENPQSQHPPGADSVEVLHQRAAARQLPASLAAPAQPKHPRPGGIRNHPVAGSIAVSLSDRRPASQPPQCQPPQGHPIWSDHKWQTRGSERWHFRETGLFFGRFYFARVRVQKETEHRPLPGVGGTTSPNVKGGYNVSPERHEGSRATLQPKRPHYVRVTRRRGCERLGTGGHSKGVIPPLMCGRNTGLA